MNTVPLLDPHTQLATRLFAEQIAARYDVAGALLFGSRARQNHHPDSDADVAFDVLLETGIRVPPLPVWLDEWEHPERHANPALLANIAREGVRV